MRYFFMPDCRRYAILPLFAAYFYAADAAAATMPFLRCRRCCCLLPLLLLFARLYDADAFARRFDA